MRVAAVAVLTALALTFLCVPASAHLGGAPSDVGYEMRSVTPLDSAPSVDSAGHSTYATDAGATAAASTTDMPAMPGMVMCKSACLTETMDDCTVAGAASPGTPATALEPRLTFVYLVPRLTQTGTEEPVVERFTPPPSLFALCVLRV